VTGTDPSLGELRLHDFLDRLASHSPTPGGGGAAALTAAVAAGLAAMTARLSAAQVADWEQCATTMDLLRAELIGLADDDAAAYADVLVAIREASSPARASKPPEASSAPEAWGKRDGSRAPGFPEASSPRGASTPPEAPSAPAASSAPGTPSASGPRGRQPPDRRGEALLVASEVPLAIADHAAVIAEAASRLAQTGNAHLRGDARTAVHLARAAARSAAGLVAINVTQGRLDPELTARARAAADRADRAERAGPDGP
jgi:formiminotetrahydrofolate cyclodeaminase